MGSVEVPVWFFSQKVCARAALGRTARGEGRHVPTPKPWLRCVRRCTTRSRADECKIGAKRWLRPMPKTPGTARMPVSVHTCRMVAVVFACFTLNVCQNFSNIKQTIRVQCSAVGLQTSKPPRVDRRWRHPNKVPFQALHRPLPLPTVAPVQQLHAMCHDCWRVGSPSLEPRPQPDPRRHHL